MVMKQDENNADFMARQLEKLVHHLEGMRVAEYVEMLQRPTRIIFLNFVAGISRGLGIAIGATLIFALMLELLRRIIMLHIPGIGEFVAEIVRIVESKNGGPKF
jgi:hypothetical protein